ncbi:restriction endonuclease subunit S [Prosthecochloris sp. CIB 2401]|uniref:restriction endonuclease subunit S n=1 Tax=Prosthecochloris sp. CIB 2401 TaxID=1868325 RepID=UPI0009F51A8A|nr:restriction endonuclease subunit S [Prosthecochloris sp. CIB 2401]
MNSRAKGSGTPHVDPDLLWNYSFPIPPLNEQHRIVAKIEELFSELDKGVESLKKAREQLKVYRQALLKYAFEGKLTEDWRKKNADKLETADQLLDRIKHEREARYQQQLEEWKSAVEQWEKDGKVGKRPSKQGKPKHLKSIGKDIQQTLPNLPDGWVWGKLGLMTTGVEYGSSTKSKKTGSHPVLRMGNIQNGKFDWSALCVVG